MMNVLFISLLDFNTIEENGIYTDVLRHIRNKGNNIYAISPMERRKGRNTYLIEEKKCKILKLRIGNIQKTNIIEKGISTLTIEKRLVLAIKKYFSDVKIDLVLYPTPPITLYSAIDYVKRRDGAKSYLMLKDIFPQNSLDLGMMKKTGLKGWIYKFFVQKEKSLYRISDKIGCMSQANVDYIINNNPDISKEKIEIFPNCIEVVDKSVTSEEKACIRNKYGIPLDKTVFIYGGNLGKPQSVSFIIDCLKTQQNNKDVFFLIVGDGTDYHLLDEYMHEYNQDNLKLMKRLPKEDYDAMVGACDVGLIFLDYHFTIPNFPSRLLSYMQAKIPVLAVTDINTDIGKIIVENKFGWWCPSNSTKEFSKMIKIILGNDNEINGENGFLTLNDQYNVEKHVNKLF